MLRRFTSTLAARSSQWVAATAPAAAMAPVRWLNLHEYQAKLLMNKYNIKTQRGAVASTPEEAEKVAASLNTTDLVVKAQIHAGGRGKGTFTDGFKSGVHFCETPEQVKEVAGKMLGNTLVTKQTGAAGQLCSKVTVLQGVDIMAEKYFAILMDRAHNGPVLVGSRKGGMDIEAVAAETPEEIHTVPVDIATGITHEQTTELAKNIGFEGADIDAAATQMEQMYALFLASDCTQVEINPLSPTDQGVIPVDAKLNFDDNAAFRQAEVFAMRDTAQEDAREVAASKYDLNYIGLDGNIGCMVNGAGLAMATMDIIDSKGGKPANFLDVGGSASEEQVREAFKILQDDGNVQAILVNIFGGIMKCDVISEGIVNAAKQVDLRVPLVVRLEGTNVERGKELLESSGLPIITASDLDDAATKAVAALA